MILINVRILLLYQFCVKWIVCESFHTPQKFADHGIPSLFMVRYSSLHFQLDELISISIFSDRFEPSWVHLGTPLETFFGNLGAIGHCGALENPGVSYSSDIGFSRLHKRSYDLIKLIGLHRAHRCHRAS